ncbi:Protein of unknown function DUF262 [Actinopolyspora alba]|uniref:GmrSD restriction endonucleases N-terminal domain-containing protein n=1 Tax=Actinopolyspora alba TaxID=673379 RepID=A0A1I2C5M3_9ACTN|nr:DUF262 domain-containing protein [Actinopolyspora alba]SFE62940.1 Protein of unknown function DUF262 [Actinopolyspora alba]
MIITMELDSQPKSIQSIYSWFSTHQLYVNRRYQRKLVWSQLEKQKLIESVLRKFPVPAILLAERDTGDYEIIDGLQRLHTLVSFIENSFPSVNAEYFDVSQFPTAKARADEGKFDPVANKKILDQSDISTFLDYSLAISIMRGATESEIDDVFARINTYGHRLSDQERRQAGVQDNFSNLIRQIACEIRGDASSDTLELSQMPSISIDLPMSKHGYDVVADEVFWVRQGILRSTELRDSMDEQCLADIVGSIVTGEVIERSKDMLDRIYDSNYSESRTVADTLGVYGEERVKSEIKYCVDEILKICNTDPPMKLRDIVFTQRSTNPFSAVFAVIMIAFHETLFGGQKKISNYAGIKNALSGVYGRLETSRKATAAGERRRNVDTVKGLIDQYVVDDKPKIVVSGHSTSDIDAAIRRSEIELPYYELKQGLLNLDNNRSVETGVLDKVAQTICAIANNGRERAGSVIIGVADKDEDASRIRDIDGIDPRRVGRKFAVGVKREAEALGESVETYFARWKNSLRNSELSEPLRSSVLSSIDYNEYFGLGVIVIHVPPQGEISFLGEETYWREGDETKRAPTQRNAMALAKRFV